MPMAATAISDKESPAAQASDSHPTTPAGRIHAAISTTQGSVAQMREQAEHTRGTAAYITLFVVLLVSGLGLPMPEEIPLMLAGYVARHGAASLYILIPVGLAGVLIADIMLFTAARRWRGHIFRLRWIRAMIRPRHLNMARTQFHKHGMKIVVIARWLPALRTAVCLTAGLTGVSTLHFLLVDATAACITVPTGVLLGYFAANQIDRLIATFVKAEHTALMLTLLAMAVGLVCWLIFLRRKRRPARLVPHQHSGNGQKSATEEPVCVIPGTNGSDSDGQI